MVSDPPGPNVGIREFFREKSQNLKKTGNSNTVCGPLRSTALKILARKKRKSKQMVQEQVPPHVAYVSSCRFPVGMHYQLICP
jgi:hypothetical protein